MTTLIEQKSEKDIKQKRNNHTDEEIEIDLMDILRKIIGIRKTIYKAAGIGFVIGVIIAISIPKQYTVEVTLSPEMGSVKGGGLSGLAASFLGSEVSMGDGTDALNTSLSPDIISSTPFLLELSTMNIPVSKDENMTLNTYLDEESSPWWNYVIGFPGMVIGGVKSLFAEEENESRALNRISQGTIELSKKESKKIEILKEMIVAAVDKKTSITSIAVTMQNPRAAAVVADSVVKKLQEYIIDYRITKSKEDCIYLEKLFKERQQEFPATLHLLERSGKQGLGTAYLTGFRWGLDNGFDYICEMDCDFSHNPDDLLRLYQAAAEGNDVVVGSRYVQGVNVVNWPMSRLLMSYFASMYVRIVTRMPLRDATAGFVCYSRHALETIDLDAVKMKGYGFQIEMKFTAWTLGFKLKEVPIIFTDRTLGTSKMSGGIFREAFFGVLGLPFRSIRSTKNQ